jgi:ubiquinone/menaquinone biosynthesis C-methylase UbiE
MPVSGAYVGRGQVERYDARRFGGRSGQYILHKDCLALESLLPPSADLILDIPCGTGVFSEGLAKVGYQVVGADASLLMLIKTRQRSGTIPTVQSDINHLPFRDDSFEAVMTIRLFQHFPKDAVTPMLRELKRIVAPGGRVIFDTFRWSPRCTRLFRRFLKGDMFVLSHRDVEGMIRDAQLVKVRTLSHYLFSPIYLRKLPLWALKLLNALERTLPERWLLRTFWACTRD